jgi:hypothetical protein
MSKNMWLTKACPSSSAPLVASSSNPKRYGVRVPHLPPDTIMLGTESVPLLKEMHGNVPKARISNGSVEARPALCSRFRADGLDDGKGTARLIWQKW